MAITLTGDPPFFADIWRCPVLKQTAPRSYRVQFFSLRTYLAEFTILILACGLMAAWLAAETSSPLLFLPLAAVAIGYLWIGTLMKQLSRTHHVEFRDSELWVGTPELIRIGRICEVISVELSPAEDEWRSENGSTRIYLRLTNCELEHTTFPLLIS